MKKVYLSGFTIFFLLALLYSVTTDGFHPNKLVTLSSKNSTKAKATPEFIECQRILNEPFRYQAEGYLSYSCVSQDGAYRLSFLRKSRVGQKQSRLLRSYKLAARRLQKETGLIFLHLQEDADAFHPLTITDANSHSYQIDPNVTLFMLQKGSSNFKETIELFMAKNDIEKAKEALNKTICLLVELSEKKVLNLYGKTGKHMNIGLCDTEATLIDCGKLTYHPKAKTEVLFLRNLHALKPINKWLMLNYPELSKHLHSLCKQELGRQQMVKA